MSNLRNVPVFSTLYNGSLYGELSPDFSISTDINPTFGLLTIIYLKETSSNKVYESTTIELRKWPKFSVLTCNRSWSPDSRTFALTMKNFILLYNVKVDTEHLITTTIAGGINCIAWSPDSRKIIFSSSIDNRLHVWDVQEDRKQIVCFERDKSIYISLIRWSDDGNTILSWYYDKSISLWDVNTGKIIMIRIDMAVNICAFAFSKTGDIATFCQSSNRIRVWKPSLSVDIYDYMANFKKNYKCNIHTRPDTNICNMVFSLSGDILATNSRWEKTIDLWNVSDGTILNTILFGTFISSFVWSYDETSLTVRYAYELTRICLEKFSQNNIYRYQTETRLYILCLFSSMDTSDCVGIDLTIEICGLIM